MKESDEYKARSYLNNRALLTMALLIFHCSAMAIPSMGTLLSLNAGWLNKLSSSLDAVYTMVTAVAYLIGISFMFKALYSLKVYGELRTMMASNTSLKEPLTFILAGAVFIYLPTGFAIMMNTTFGNANVLAYTQLPSAFSLNATNGGFALLKLLQVIGVGSFVRGWVLLARSSGQQGQPGGFGKGLTHVFGGVMLMNIVGTLNIVYNTLGIAF